MNGHGAASWAAGEMAQEYAVSKRDSMGNREPIAAWREPARKSIKLYSECRYAGVTCRNCCETLEQYPSGHSVGD